MGISVGFVGQKCFLFSIHYARHLLDGWFVTKNSLSFTLGFLLYVIAKAVNHL